MKKIVLLFVLAASMYSCSIDDNNGPSYSTEFVAIESVDIPEEFIYGETHEISVSFLRPSSCHIFYDFFYEIDENQRTVAVRTVFPIDQQCETLTDDEVEVSFNFEVLSTETYIFRFYQGEDENGEDIYQIVEVPVSVD